MAAVARALSGNVKLLLLDEPFEGLAPTVVQELFTVFDRLRGTSSIVIVEHNLDLVLALADRVFALERGAVFHSGPAEPLLNDLDVPQEDPLAVRPRRDVLAERSASMCAQRRRDLLQRLALGVDRPAPRDRRAATSTSAAPIA